MIMLYSRVTAMLKVARALDQGNYALRSSVIFIAFDLEEYESQCIPDFVQDF